MCIIDGLYKCDLVVVVLRGEWSSVPNAQPATDVTKSFISILILVPFMLDFHFSKLVFLHGGTGYEPFLPVVIIPC